jgi:hypothetical protein
MGQPPQAVAMVLPVEEAWWRIRDNRLLIAGNSQDFFLYRRAWILRKGHL